MTRTVHGGAELRRATACRRRSAWPRLAALAALLCGTAAWGQVTLETAVSKVESTLDGAGRVKRELVPAEEVVPGEELRYTITFSNDSDTLVDAERIVITNPVPPGTVYVSGSAGGENTVVEYSADGESFTAVDPSGGGTAEAPATAAGSGAENGSGGPAVQSLRWTYQRDLAPGDSGEVFFHVRMQ